MVSGTMKLPVETSEGCLTTKNPFFSVEVSSLGGLVSIMDISPECSFQDGSSSSLSSFTLVRGGIKLDFNPILSLIGVWSNLSESLLPMLCCCCVVSGYKQSLINLNTSSSCRKFSRKSGCDWLFGDDRAGELLPLYDRRTKRLIGLLGCCGPLDLVLEVGFLADPPAANDF